MQKVGRGGVGGAGGGGAGGSLGAGAVAGADRWKRWKRQLIIFFTLSLTPNFGTVRHGLITFSLRIYDLFYATDSSFGG